MKRIASLLLASFMAVSLLPQGIVNTRAAEASKIQRDVDSLKETWADEGAADTTWYTKDKDATSYTITKPEEFAGIVKLTNERHTDFSNVTIKLGNDIDLAGRRWTQCIKDFKGILDGQKFQIRNFMSDGSPLFNELSGTTGGVIKDFTLSGSYYRTFDTIADSDGIHDNPTPYYGVIAEVIKGSTTANNGYRASGIMNHVNAEYTLNQKYSGFIYDADDIGDIPAIGGLFGSLQNAKITNSNNYGKLQVAMDETGKEHRDYIYFAVTGIRTGGIVGTISTYGDDAAPVAANIEKCLNYGDIRTDINLTDGYVSVGGILGDMPAADEGFLYSGESGELTGAIVLEDCANFGNVTLNQNGKSNHDVISSYYNLFAVGGILGSIGQVKYPEKGTNNKNVDINRVENSGKITLNHMKDEDSDYEVGFAGGIMGLITTSKFSKGTKMIQNSNNRGEICINTDLADADQTIEDLGYLDITVAKNTIFAGGFLGGVQSNASEPDKIVIKNNYSVPKLHMKATDYKHIKASTFMSMYVGNFSEGTEEADKNYIEQNYAQDHTRIDMYSSYYQEEYASYKVQYRLKHAGDKVDNYVDAKEPTKKTDDEMKDSSFMTLLNTNAGEADDIYRKDKDVSEYPILETIRNLRFTSADGEHWESSEGDSSVDFIRTREIPVYLRTYGKENYNVSLKWGAMDFTYVRNEEAANDTGLAIGWHGNDKENNRVSVLNNSTAPVFCTISNTASKAGYIKYNNLTAKLDTEVYEDGSKAPSFTETGKASNADVSKTTDHKINQKATMYTYLNLDGIPSRNLDMKEEIASLLITVSAQPNE